MTSQPDIRVWRRVVAFVLPLALFVGIGVSGVVLWDQGRLNRFICDGDCGPDYVVAPEGVRVLGQRVAPSPRVVSDTSVNVDVALRSVQRALRDDSLGGRVGVAVGASDGSVVASGPTSLIPASTTKVLTGFAALTSIEPGTRFSTSTVLTCNTVTLIGGGDPFLTTKRDKASDVERADLATLARRTAQALSAAGRRSVSIRFDDALFVGPAFNPTWRASYTADHVVNPTTALALFRGRPARAVAKDPSLEAAQIFAEQLARAGVTVAGSPRRSIAPADGSRLASVRSATVEQIVEYVMRFSDNEGAEALLRHVGLATGRTGSTADGLKGVRSALKRAGIDASGLTLRDGSGLSRANRIAPRTLVQTLHTARESDRTAGLLSDLPTAGFSGSMTDRAGNSGARGHVRAKTGTLRSVHSLAGYATNAAGQPIFFALMTDAARPDDALGVRAALDRATAALAACACGG